MKQQPLPPLAELLTQGGDERIALDPGTGLNAYGCPPHPDRARQRLDFASCTASIISQRGQAATRRLYRRLQQRLRQAPAAAVYARELQRLRRALCAVWGLDGAQAPAIAFASSGSELHRLARQLCATGQASALPLCVVMVAAEETGSLVPQALAGSDGDVAVELHALALRLPDGQPRPAHEIDDALADRLASAVQHGQHGQRVLLVLTDVSKTGLCAPTPARVAALCQHYGERLTVLVDACQARLSAACVRAYLAQGWMVALTGSKFFGGPAFSGALLLPEKFRQAAPATLADTLTRADWPAGWPADALPEAANFGLLLRWQAALAEMRTYFRLDEARVAAVLTRFGQAVTARILAEPRLAWLPNGASGSLPTIFSFCVRHADGRWFDAAQTARLHQTLAQGQTQGQTQGQARGQASYPPVRLGQPVCCGQHADPPRVALRLSLSAAQLSAAAQAAGDDGIADLIGRAMQALDRVLAGE